MGGTEEKNGEEREREREARGFTGREKPAESEMKEGDTRVGGRQGKTGEEREDAKMKERERGRRDGGVKPSGRE